MNLTIRKASVFDAAEIANVQLNSWREAYVGLLSQDFLDDRPLHFRSRFERWKEITQNHEYMTFVAETTDHGVIGFINGGNGRDKEFRNQGEVGALYLLKKYHGKKIGFQLLKACFMEMKIRDFKSAYAWVLKDNPTIKFYESTGAKKSHYIKEAVIGSQNVIEIQYQWPNLNLGTTENEES